MAGMTHSSDRNSARNSMPDLSIIIISYNAKDALRECLQKAYSTEGKFTKEIIVIDNKSTDGSYEMVKHDFPSTIAVRNHSNVGFAAANNQGIKIAKGRYCLFLNSDAFLPQGGLCDVLDFMDSHRDIGIVGCQLLDKNGAEIISTRQFMRPFHLFITRLKYLQKLFPQRALALLKEKEKAIKVKNIIETDWVPGCFLMFRKIITDDIGVLDEDYFFYSEEKDFCFKAKKAGWKIACFPNLRVVHLQGESSKSFHSETSFTEWSDCQRIRSEYFFYKKNYNITTVLELHFLYLAVYVNAILKNLYRADKIKFFFKYITFLTRTLIEASCLEKKRDTYRKNSHATS